jgi:3-hydroxyisobutyrate dehydrogenase-like beta-hydroxyacid dehydrogenase
MRCALIGIGLLGSAVADRLQAAGFLVRGYDIDPVKLGAFAAAGGMACESAADAAEGCAWTVTCLMSGEIVRRAVLGDRGAAEGMAPGAVLLDMTTCAPWESMALAQELASRGLTMLDATISGSSAQVRAGEGVMLVGGSDEALAKAAPILGAVGGSCVHVGPSGSGATAKLVTNLVLGLNRLALAEGLALGERAGMDAERVLEVLRAGAAYSRVMDAKGEKMAQREYSTQARLSQHRKDVGLILELAQRVGAAAPASGLHLELLTRGVDDGLGDLDNAAIVEVLRAMAAKEADGEEPGGAIA